MSHKDDSITEKQSESDTNILGAFEASKNLPQYSDDMKLREIAFFLPAGREPIVIEGHNTITLGRSDDLRGIKPIVDLSDHHAKELGVSRKHCELVFVNFRYYVRDIGSMNGTWLNGKRLEPNDFLPLTSGDALRLGSLMIVIG